MKIKILVPIYNDWQSASKLLDDIDNNIFQLYGKLGKVVSSDESIGSQFSFTSHDISASFGNNHYQVTMNLV